jgi:hypothetical protein
MGSMEDGLSEMRWLIDLRLNDKRIAYRGDPGSAHARTWVPMESGVEAIDVGEGEIALFINGVRAH